MQDRAFANDKISFAWNSEVVAIHGEDKVSGVRLRDTVTGDERDLEVTGLFVAIGHDPRSELLAGQVDLDDEGYVLVEGRTQQTNLAGVFACGDLVDHVYRQAVTAAGTGCAAALDAERYLADLEHAASTAANSTTSAVPAASDLPDHPRRTPPSPPHHRPKEETPPWAPTPRSSPTTRSLPTCCRATSP